MALSKKPSARYASFTAVINSKFFLWGGRTQDGENDSLHLLYYFDFSREQWETSYLMGELPPGFRFGSCATDNNGDFYVYGGEDVQHSYTGDLYKINLSNTNDIFFEKVSSVMSSSTTPMRKNDSGKVVFRRNVILFGGKPVSEDSDERTNELHIFHMTKGIWKSVPLKGDTPQKCSNFSFTKLQEDVVVMFGGYLGNDQYSNELYTLDLINMKWKNIAKRELWPAPRRAHSACVLGYDTDYAEIVFIGGKRGSQTLNEIWKLNPKEWKWEKMSIHGHNSFMRRWHMSGSRQISPLHCEVIVFGGIRGREILSETALIRFRYKHMERTWVIEDIADDVNMGNQKRIDHKDLLPTIIKQEVPITTFQKSENKSLGSLSCWVCGALLIAVLAVAIVLIISFFFYN